ncbi:MAG: sulfatase-like hydrolase/transferase [Patescibacteria group bacterium]
MLKKHQRLIYSLLGAFVLAAGLGFYFAPHHPRLKFVIYCNIYWLLFFVGFWILALIIKKLLSKRHKYWTEYFYQKLPEFFFFVSLPFLAFLGRTEIMSLIIALLFFIILFWRAQKYLQAHPSGNDWQTANKSIFLLGGFFFVLFGVIQYLAHKYYILDSSTLFHVVVLLRAAAMTALWLVGFVWSQAFYHSHKGCKRYFLLVFWLVCFAAAMIFWVANLGVLWGSGLYLTPTAMEHASGASKVIFNQTTMISFAIAAACVALLGYLLRSSIKARVNSSQRPWFCFGWALSGLALLIILVIAPIKNTPEAKVLYSFYDYYFGKNETIEINKEILQKLNRNFGLTYNPDEFYVNHREKVFSASQNLLPVKLQKQKPNIMIVFFESLSANLTDVYTDIWNGELTPNLKNFSEDKHTTVFNNFYNASTPTITGILSELCSFLPPTGHTEIHIDGKLSKFFLSCLPDILRQQAGYKKTVYITAVEKDYAHKDTIYKSAGVDDIYGTEELAKIIPEEPLAWGFSDHQMFSVMPKFLSETPQPFLLMLSTVDTHQPYITAKDIIKFRDGKSVVLSAFHTTDNAFGKFWDYFKQSEFYNNTILIVVADHAIFPGSYHNVPEYKNKPEYEKLSFYDENAFMMYVPGNILPKQIKTFASGLDFAPTLLHMLNVNVKNAFEGHSIFEDRKKYPNVLGMHEFGLYINQETKKGREIVYDLPINLQQSCANSLASPKPQWGEGGPASTSTPELTLCEYEQFYKWKRNMLEEGRLWITGK